MQKSSIAREHRGGVSTSKVLQGFKPVSHCGKPVILRALARRISCNRRSFASLKMTGKRQKAAFTLAEVLITLGIIGIIAAMTLPTLIANYQKKVVETRVKAFYSKMNQIYLRSYVDNGDTADWLVSKRYTYDETVDWLKKYFLPYTQGFDLQSATTTNETESGPWTQNVVIVRIPDGTAYAFSVDENGMDIAFFVNGNLNDLGPRNKFTFQFSKRKNYLTDEGSMEKQSLNFIDPYILNWDGNRETLKTHHTWGCRKGCTNCAYCTKLLQLNGWEIPDDYPW